MSIHLFDDTLTLSKAAVALFIAAAREAVEARGQFTVALAGGATPLHLYQLLAQSPNREQVPWRQMWAFWGDERLVPLTDERSNAGMAYEALLNHVPIPKEQIFPMWTEQEPEEAAQHYEELLHEHFGYSPFSFDLVLLGLGDDGHTASLFPHTDVLQEQFQWVKSLYKPDEDIYRLTLTAPIINMARKVVFLTFGAKKADAVYEVLEGAYDPEQYPAQLIQPEEGELVWLISKAAASRLSGKK